MTTAPKAVTIREFQAASGLSKPTIYKMIREGQLPGYKIGSRYVVPRPWFERWLSGDWVPADEAAPPVQLVHRRTSA